jgi:hypothetical protein
MIIKPASVHTSTSETKTLNHSVSHNTAEYSSETFLYNYKVVLKLRAPKNSSLLEVTESTVNSY